jgi:hypothetical protein
LKNTTHWMTSAVAALALSMPALAEQAAAAKDPLEGLRPELRKVFTRTDRDGDFRLTRIEWKNSKFDQVDANYDGFITPKEFNDNLDSKTAPETRLHKKDADGDGAISRSEFPGDDVAFRNLDVNGDGVLSSADHQPAPANTKGIENRFKAMDVNGDGVVAPDEWRGTENSFKKKDANVDGYLSLEELMPPKKDDDASQQ